MNLELSEVTGKVTNFKTRKENHGEDIAPAADVWVTIPQREEDLARFLAPGETLGLWDENGNPQSIANVTLAHKYDRHSVVFDTGGTMVTIAPAKIGKVKVVPKASRLFDLQFKIAFETEDVELDDLKWIDGHQATIRIKALEDDLVEDSEEEQAA